MNGKTCLIKLKGEERVWEQLQVQQQDFLKSHHLQSTSQIEQVSSASDHNQWRKILQKAEAENERDITAKGPT